MKLQVFDGGISRYLEPQLIAVNQAVEYVNIDNAKGVLTPVKQAKATGLKKGKFPYYFRAGAEWIASDTQKSYVEFQNKLYSTDGTAALKYAGNGNWQKLGIAAPTTAVTLAKSDAPEALTEVKVENITTAGNLPASTLEYRIINVANGYYSKSLDVTIGPTTTNTSSVSVRTAYPPNQWASAALMQQVSLSVPTKFRSVKLSGFKGALGTKAIVYRLYDGAYRKLTEITALTVGTLMK